MATESPPTFGALLHRHRLAAGLSQEALAERAGVSARAISDLERGARRAPYPHTVAQLARALRLGPADRARLEAAVPPRRAADPLDPSAPTPIELRPTTTLPTALTSFVGRERELAEVGRLLATTRLLTLTGAGGVGKTRLALAAARCAYEDDPDGVWTVELASLTDPALVPHAVAAALGLREQPGRPALDMLLGAVATRRLMLVLDNCEHLLDACAALADALLRACPAARVLATSREPLGIAGETTWRVPSLTLPDPDNVPALDELARCDAIRLFVDRAAAALPSFALTDGNAAAVTEVCRRLDGIPLALELAAARVRGLPPEQLAARLDDRFRLLTAGNRAAPPRQQTLRAAIDWSHALLGEPERALLRRLAVFAGGWTLAAAEAVGAGEDIDEPDVLALLLRLVDRSLVLAEEHDGAARYRLLETVREYAREKLAESGEAAATRTRHLAWSLALAERAEPELHGPDQVAWLDRLEAEHDNLRAALAWSLEAIEETWEGGGGPVEAGLRLAGAVWWLWFLRHWREGAAWLDRLLARSEGMATAARAKALHAAGVIRRVQLGDSARGLALLEESVALYRAVGEARGLAYALGSFGFHGRRRGQGPDYAGGTARLVEALRLARASGDRWLTACVLTFEAQSADLTRAGEAARARAAAEEGLALCRALGDTQGMGFAQRALGRILLHAGDHERARAAFAADLAATRAVGDGGGVVTVLYLLGSVALAQGDHAGAGTYFRELLAEDRLLGNRDDSDELLENLAAVAVVQGQPARAARLLGAAETARRRDGVERRRSEQARYEETEAAARAALGAAAFAAAWAAGEAMTPDETAAYVLADEAESTADATGPQPAADGLTPRELDVLRLIAAGRSNREIGEELSLSVRTVERHITNLYSKIDADNRADATAYAFRRALV